MQKHLDTREMKAVAKSFNENKATLAARVAKYREEGKLYIEIATLLNAEGATTKTGLPWNPASLCHLMKHSSPPAAVISSKEVKAQKKRSRKGVTKTSDKK